MMEPIEIVCPRCSKAAEERFYGPCSACRSEMGATVRNEAQVLDDVVYEPKMNVVPNQIATKD